MYIEICKDVVEDTIVNKGDEFNNSLELLQLFAFFSSKGNHIVTVPCLRNNESLTKKLCQAIGTASVSKLKRGESVFYMLQSIKSRLTVYCLVTYSEDKTQDDRAIVYNPAKMQKFEPYLRTKLITENLLDAVFFDYVAHYYLRKILFKGVKIRFEATPGGGSTTCEVVKNEILEGRRFCLVVVDSDKKYPHQKEYGDTAGKILKVVNLHPSTVCACYVMERVMEVENLIPHRIVRQYASDKTDCDVLNRDVAYYDMKEGINLKGLYNNDVYNYISGIFPELDYSQRNEARRFSDSRSEFEQYIDKQHLTNVLKRGFGLDLLRIVICACDDNGRIKYPELKEEMLKKIRTEDLTMDQAEEWDHIGEKVFSWTCGLPSKMF